MANQGRILDRGDHFAILDQVGLGTLKDEIAGRDINLAAAKIDGPNAFLDRRDDLVRVVLAA